MASLSPNQGLPLIGSSAEANRLRSEIVRAAPSDAPILLTGESGTGKDRVAHEIHLAGPNARQPFITLNTSGMPDDILDRELFGPPGNGHTARYPAVPRFLWMAQGGTLLLDDIGRTSPVLQARLRHLIRSGTLVDPDGRQVRFTARLIAASNSDLAEALRTDRLRRDLYDSLAVIHVELPPLRDRGRDAGEIAAALYPRFLAEAGHAPQPLPAALAARINTHPWPGNVRELLNVLRRIALSPDDAPDLPAESLGDLRGGDGVTTALAGLSFAKIERQVILDAIERNRGSVQKAADELELAASTLYRKLKAWQEDFGNPPTLN